MQVLPRGQVVRPAKARYVLSTTCQRSSTVTKYQVISMSLPVSGGVWKLDVDSDGCHVAAGPENVWGFENQMNNLGNSSICSSKDEANFCNKSSARGEA